jgi:hypothetical protein
VVAAIAVRDRLGDQATYGLDSYLLRSRDIGALNAFMIGGDAITFYDVKKVDRHQLPPQMREVAFYPMLPITCINRYARTPHVASPYAWQQKRQA